MIRIKLLTLTVLALSATVSQAAPLDLQGKTLKQVFDELLPGMGAEAMNVREKPQQQWQALCLQAAAPGNEAVRKEACLLMTTHIGPSTPRPARVWLLKQLERIGAAECVTAVAALLDDQEDEVRDAALRCLAGSPAPEATAQLTAKLAGSTGKNKVGLLNALGHRRDAAAIPALAKELANLEKSAAVAAAQALSKIGSPEAGKVLMLARYNWMSIASEPEPVHRALADACLRCADQRLREGQTAEATAIYQALDRTTESRPIRLAALRGILQADGDGAGKRILEIFRGTDADAQAIAVRQVEELRPEALQAVGAGLSQLPPAGQVTVLRALADRGDRSQMPAALAAIRSADESVRQAGVLALGRLGDASVVPLLIELVYANSNLSDAARDSLGRLAATGVNEQLVALLQTEKEPGKHAMLITVAERRRLAAAVPLLLADIRGENVAVRGQAMGALRQLAGPEHIPGMIQGLFKAPRGSERDEAERAIADVCTKNLEPGQRAEPVLAVYQRAGQAERAMILLPLLGRLGGPNALVVVRTALADSDARLAMAAARALANWPDPSVSEDLLKLAQTAADNNQRRQAWQALVRVNSMLNEGSPKARFAMLQKAMELAGGDDDRKKVLRGLGNARVIEALRFVLPYLNDSNLAQEACRTVVELAHSQNLRNPNQKEFNRVLERVIAMCNDKGLVERARRYREGR